MLGGTMPSHAHIPYAMGFREPVLESQEAFRTLLRAMAYPGRVVTFKAVLEIPRDLHLASWVVLLTLGDETVRFWTDLPVDHESRWAIQSIARVRTVSEPREADIALVVDPSGLSFPVGLPIGTEEAPYLGATVIMQVSSLCRSPSAAYGDAFLLSGPGIEGRTPLCVRGCPKSFWDWRRSLEDVYPRGLDVLFTHASDLIAVPRSTHVIPVGGSSCTSQ